MDSIENNANFEHTQNQSLLNIKPTSKSEKIHKKETSLNKNEEEIFDEVEKSDDKNETIINKTTSMKAMLNAKLIQEIAQKRKETIEKEKIEKEVEENEEIKEEIQNNKTSFNYKKAIRAYNSS